MPPAKILYDTGLEDVYRERDVWSAIYRVEFSGSVVAAKVWRNINQPGPWDGSPAALRNVMIKYVRSPKSLYAYFGLKQRSPEAKYLTAVAIEESAKLGKVYRYGERTKTIHDVVLLEEALRNTDPQTITDFNDFARSLGFPNWVTFRQFIYNNQPLKTAAAEAGFSGQKTLTHKTKAMWARYKSGESIYSIADSMNKYYSEVVARLKKAAEFYGEPFHAD